MPRSIEANPWGSSIAAALSAVFLTSCGVPSRTPDQPPPPEPPAAEDETVMPERPVRVLAHYMPWFRAEPQTDGSILWEHWQWFGKGPKHDPDDILENGQRDIASVFYPLIGPYDGRDPAVLEYHFLTARFAGIGGFVADWYGPGNYTDEVFAEMVKAGERYGMHVAICLEDKSFFPDYSEATTRAEAVAEAERQVRHVLDTHARSPAYLRWEGRPVFFVFNGHQDGALGRHALSPEEWDDVLQREGIDIFLVRGYLDDPYLDVVDGGYLWCGSADHREAFYSKAKKLRESGRLERVVGVASPGFDDRGTHGWGHGPRFTDRRGTQEYEDNWKEVLLHQPDAVQVVTWNDFAEGTVIEPTVEFRFTFVDLTEQYVAAFTGRPALPDNNDWAYRVYHLRRYLQAHENPGLEKNLDALVQAMVAGTASGETLANLEHVPPPSHRLPKEPP